LKLVANLPYAVATPVISNLLLLTDRRSSAWWRWCSGKSANGSQLFRHQGVRIVGCFRLQSVADVELSGAYRQQHSASAQVASAIVCIRPMPPASSNRRCAALPQLSAPICTLTAARTCAEPLRRFVTRA